MIERPSYTVDWTAGASVAWEAATEAMKPAAAAAGVPERAKMGVGTFIRAVGAASLGRSTTRRQWIIGLALMLGPWPRWPGWSVRGRKGRVRAL